MKHQRKFIIKVNSLDLFIKTTLKSRGYDYYHITLYQNKAKVWKYRKSCINYITLIKNNLDPIRKKLLNNKLEVIEITDKQTLRNIKLKKLNKK